MAQLIVDHVVNLILAEWLLDVINYLLGLKRQDHLVDLLHVVDRLIAVLLLQTLEHQLSINFLLEWSLCLSNSRDLLCRTYLSCPVQVQHTNRRGYNTVLP